MKKKILTSLVIMLALTTLIGCGIKNEKTTEKIIKDNFYLVEESSMNFLEKNISELEIDRKTEEEVKQELGKPNYTITYNIKEDNEETSKGKVLVYLMKDEPTAVYIDIKDEKVKKYYIGEMNGLDLEKVKQIVEELTK